MLKIIILIVVIAAVFVLITYNSLTKEKNRIELAEQELRKYEATGSDQDIDNARKYYTAVLRDYNTKVESFPTSIIADAFNFPKMHSDDFDEGL
ncbi:MAG: LemA family protein [Mogibacterium sp.]|nr:LemA family protein [Mogibacterium sp.]